MSSSMSPPHISDMVQPYQPYPTPAQPEVVPQYQRDPAAPQIGDYKGAPANAPVDAPVSVSVTAQNYRDQCQFHFALC